ncbi:preprotein translocase subunit SecE [Marinithermus hydrothermalis]|uniref:Protein translocase subunit SecE n=1 Tax=Marinithermus hydrothermalis (strain DSM 14884 / JCM 11576 / T1) TaxID=869210 RepID=F2NL03_MARHT|nr:preprotein translocase subunit SecE [Marinithermus hydrothermalis]AEB11192.1 preprotein translocase, SecE subunit [Marinithermus hydrothermalis DSM 14884]
MGRIIAYFREARAELARVTWPSREEIIQSTEAILLFTLFSMTILWVYDLVFGQLMRLIIR